MTVSKPDYSIVIPAYNESKVLGLLVVELEKYIPKNTEIIFVDDCSTDKTLSVLKQIRRKNESVKIISLAKNSGQENAILVGLKHSLGGAVIVMDSDLQDPPAIIPKMIEGWKKGSKIILPVRKSRQDSRLKIFSGKVFYFFLNLLSKNYSDPRIGSFFLIDKKIARQIVEKSGQIRFIRSYLQQVKIPKTYIEFKRDARKAGKTGYTFGKMTNLALVAIGATKIKRNNEIKEIVGI